MKFRKRSCFVALCFLTTIAAAQEAPRTAAPRPIAAALQPFVQHAGFLAVGKTSQAAFRKAAEEEFSRVNR
jgi:hypothetical protein